MSKHHEGPPLIHRMEDERPHDEPIGKKRLEARPETTLCIKCKEDQEREERTMG